MTRVRALAAALLLLMPSGAAFAEGAPAASVQPAPAPAWLAPNPAPYAAPPQTGSIWRGVGALLLLGGLGGLALYARKRRRGPGAGPGSTPTLRVLETVRLGAHGELVVAEVFGELMLLGVTSHSIRRVATFRRAAGAETEPSAATLTAPTGAAASDPAPFASALKALLRGGAGRAADSEPPASANAAVAIAAQTTDTVERRASPRAARAGATYAPPAPEPVAPRKPVVEGQAAGLRRRRP